MLKYSDHETSSFYVNQVQLVTVPRKGKNIPNLTILFLFCFKNPSSFLWGQHTIQKLRMIIKYTDTCAR
jgi:hypothetical protein